MSKKLYTQFTNPLNLPQFRTIDEFSEIIGLSARLLYCLSTNTETYYKSKAIPKKNGSLREIFIPSYTLRIVQRWILVNILNKLEPSDQAMAFRKGVNFGHKQNALYHAQTLYGLSIDLKDFFPSISVNKIYTIFSSLGYNAFASTILSHLCTLDGKLPQGGVCSPALSNLVCLNLDKRMIGLCGKRGIMFTRYADDMYFSCDDKIRLLTCYRNIVRIISDEDFHINDNKTHFHTPSNKKRITGIVVSSAENEEANELKAPRRLKKKIRSEIFKNIVSGNYENKNHLLGEISYVAYIEKDNQLQFLNKMKKYIAATAAKIEYFPELVEAYNDNLFFRDMSPIQTKTIDIIDREDIDNLDYIFWKRQGFLRKNGIIDICEYENWPQPMFKCFDEELGYDESLPF